MRADRASRAGRRIPGQLVAQSCIEDANIDAHYFVLIAAAHKILDTSA